MKKIKASGCNVLLIQKSILRDATNELSLHYLAKAKILVVRDIERDEIEFIAKTLGLQPIAHVDSMKPEKLGSAALVEDVAVGTGRVVKVTGIAKRGATATVLLRGSNALVLDEADRSLHDALCVVRCLVHNRALLPGGGAAEIELALALQAWAKELPGQDAIVMRAVADAVEVIPYTLAENAGLNAIAIVTELRNLHAAGHRNHGINVRKGAVTDSAQIAAGGGEGVPLVRREALTLLVPVRSCSLLLLPPAPSAREVVAENVVQPLLVSTSAITLAAECVRMVLKIDDIGASLACPDRPSLSLSLCSPLAHANAVPVR